MPSFVIVTECGMPHGFAASNYVRLLADGLSRTGAQIKVLIPWHTAVSYTHLTLPTIYTV